MGVHLKKGDKIAIDGCGELNNQIATNSNCNELYTETPYRSAQAFTY